MEAARFFVGGEWRTSPETAPVVNPYSGETEGAVYQAGPGDIEDAIKGTVAAFSRTRRLHSYERAGILRSAAESIASHKEDIARLITSDTGKPISIARGEVDRSVFTFSVAAEEAGRIGGEYLPLDLAEHSKGRFGLTRRFPLGPVGAITPFNFPLNLVAHKLAPAIAAGNSVVLKPSSSGARIALRLGELLEGAGIPLGAVSIVTCTGGKAAQLITDQRLKLISFTGSPAVGWALKSQSGKKKVLLELGGNAGVIVDTGVDLELTGERIAQGAFANAGQSCIAVQRIFVQRGIFDEFVALFVKIAEAIPVGDPSLDSTVVGPMITEEAAQKVENWIKEAVAGGAILATGGKRKGAVLKPTVLTDVKPEMSVCREEVFAPLVTIEPFETIREAVGRVNDSSYGLQAGIFTNDLSGAFYAYRELEVGGVVLNDFPTYRIDHMPYGGVKDSGFGREGIRYAIEEMTEMKLLVANIS